MMESIWRLSNKLHKLRVPFLPNVCYAFNRIVFSAAIPPESTIGEGVLFGYKGLGIVIHRRAIIGNNVQIGAHVTIGGRGNHTNVPVIEDNVLIGSGAKILGPVRIGGGAKIGANAVVLHDVPPGATAVGIPAKVRQSDNSE